jgi:Ca2+-dependent lipid-binding protein
VTKQETIIFHFFLEYLTPAKVEIKSKPKRNKNKKKHQKRLMIVVIEVVEATCLIAEDQGSSNPFVEVEFGGQIQQTRTKLEDLSPSWKETILFQVHNKSQLPKEITITVFHEQNCCY